MIEYFRRALKDRGSVLAGDASSDAPALQEADGAFVLPRVDADDYIETLIELCRKEKIDLLFSLNDLELPYLADNFERFIAVGTTPVVSCPRVINVCFDKWITYEALQSWGLKGPRTYLTLNDALEAIRIGSLNFPLVVKPRWGSASIGILYPEDIEELQWAYGLSRRQVERSILSKASTNDSERSVMIQEKVVGPEYGLDVINDLEGRYITTFVKRKLNMRAGETDRAVTERNPELNVIGETLGRSLKHVGNMDCDVVIGDKGPIVLELNPRFGGGYPFSHIAGANLPAALIAWAEGAPLNPDWLTITYDVTAAKCDRLVLKTI